MEKLSTNLCFPFAQQVCMALAFVLAQADAVLGQQPPKSPVRHSTSLDRLSSEFRTAAERLSSSVVAITALHGPRCTEEWARLKGIGPLAPEAAVAGRSSLAIDSFNQDRSGSGIVLDASGIILTNYHVVEGADAVVVILPNGEEFPAQNVWGDGVSDLAIVRISGANDLVAAPLGDSDKLLIGDWVMAVGHPFGLDLSISAGIVSGKDRKLPHNCALMIQTDTVSNPGNSGGPLINLAGQVVGIVEGAAGESGTSSGVNYAIPVNHALRVAKELQRSGRMQWPVLGTDSQALLSSLARERGLRPGEAGTLITDVAPGSPADRAGLRSGDVLTHLAGRSAGSPAQFHQALLDAPLDVKSTLRCVRNGQEMIMEFEPEPFSIPLTHAANPNSHRAEPIGDDLGLTVGAIEDSRELGYPDPVTGAMVTHVRFKSPAYISGICAGMILRKVDGVEITSAADYSALKRRQSKSDAVTILVRSPQGSRFMAIKK